ncbi:MAG: TonB-dependent receptor, partial [Herbaspirillum sp.]
MNKRFKSNQSQQHVNLMRHLAPSLMALAIAGAYANAYAQTQDQSLPTVTVTAPAATADTLPTIEQARAQIATVAGGANIVDAEQYKEGRVSTLSDALQFSPGVFVASRFGAEESRMSIRGSGLQRTYHMRGIEVLQDGVPLNLADGAVDFQAIEPLAARYVEVYRGANGLQFGSATMGGAVNFVSPSGLTAAPVAARVELGSYGYKRAQVSTAGKTDTLDWFIAGSEFYQDGYRDHSRQDTQRFSGNLGIRLSDTIETRFFLNVVNTNSALPGTLSKAEMNANPRQQQTDAFTVNGNQHRNFELYRLSNLTNVRLDAEQHVEIGSFYSYKSLFHPIYQVLEQDSNDYGLNLRYVGNQALWNHKNQLIIGATLAAGTLADNRFQNVFGQPG